MWLLMPSLGIISPVCFYKTPLQTCTLPKPLLGGATTRLVVGKLDTVVRELFSVGLAPSTLRSYRSGSGTYTKFCMENDLTPFPAFCSCSWHRYNYKKGIARTSIKKLCLAGLGDPQMLNWSQLVRGLKKKMAGHRGKPRLPITPTVFEECGRSQKILSTVGSHTYVCAFLDFCTQVPTEMGFNPAVYLSEGDIRVDSRLKPSYSELPVRTYAQLQLFWGNMMSPITGAQAILRCFSAKKKSCSKEAGSILVAITPYGNNSFTTTRDLLLLTEAQCYPPH